MSDSGPEPVTTETDSKKNKPSFLKRMVGWLVAILLTFIVGFGLAYFLIAAPAQTKLAATSEELSAKQALLTTSELTLKQTQKDLETAQAQVADLQAQHDKVQALLVVQNAEVSTIVAIKALSSSPVDNLTARQALEQLAANMDALVTLHPGDTSEALKARVDGALSAFPVGEKVLPELNALFTNLLLLAQELQTP